MDRIKEAVALLSGQNKPADQNGSARSILRIVITVLAIAGLAWLLFTVVRDLIVYGLYFRYVDELAAKTGLNKYLINVLAAAGLAPFLLGFKYYFFSLKRSKRTQGAAMLLGMTIIYNLALYTVTRDNLIGRFYTITPDGVKYSDRALDDGREWQKVTRDNLWYVTHLAIGKKVDPIGRDWFDQKSGLPLLWYSKLDSEIQFYDGPGYDRFTAEPLKAVTKDLFLEWRRSARSSKPATVSSAKLPLDKSVVLPPCPNAAVCVDHVAPVNKWSAKIISPTDGGTTSFDGWGKKYTVLWNDTVEEDLPESGGKKTPSSMYSFRLKSREPEPVTVRTTHKPPR